MYLIHFAGSYQCVISYLHINVSFLIILLMSLLNLMYVECLCNVMM